MKISVLASGSKGNCVYIEGSSGALLIDAGRPAREILGNSNHKGRLFEAGGKRELIEAVLVTHEHCDHVKSLGPVAKSLSVPVYGTEETLDAVSGAFTKKPSVLRKAIRHNEPITVGEFKITSFPVSHDAVNPCGYMIEEGSVRVCYCTDTGVVNSHMLNILKKADGIILESNHCRKMLMNGPYPAFLKKRIASPKGHLSNDDAARVLMELSGNIHFAILAHLSEENNEPDIALRSANQALGLSADDTEIFAASSVDLERKPPVIKPLQKNPTVCSDECWKISVIL